MPALAILRSKSVVNTSKTKRYTLQVTAYHEAGHAVVGWRYRAAIGVNGVWVNPRKPTEGGCHHPPMRNPIDADGIFQLAQERGDPRIWSDYRMQIENAIEGQLAGGMAEKRFRGLRGFLLPIRNETDRASWMEALRCGRCAELLISSGDTDRAMLYLAYLKAAEHGREYPTPDDMPSVLVLLPYQEAVARFLRRPEVWRAVQRLARELVRHGRVSAEKAERIISATGVRQMSLNRCFGRAIRQTNKTDE